ncbi:DUF397 domain-containing protein [Streptomyces niveiscabiei]|uniref:DUF397 domain-containing protein n=1 Tax=Streptomyces niveiscabiei TaxID=164115 RepID=UPI0029A6C9E0|nr:DUF397 domain-containing protein [Streptomyces niveiscabiei]MDX3387932.1 DUF397 domain-containing protein [Streptomyces niveiscabiei]
MADRTWRKSSYSNADAGNCLEVLDGHPTAVPVRDSKTPHAPTLLIPAPAWTPFIEAVRTSRLHP